MSAAMFWCNIYICHFRSIFLEMPNLLGATMSNSGIYAVVPT